MFGVMIYGKKEMINDKMIKTKFSILRIDITY